MIFTSEVCGVVLIAPFDKISRPPCSTIRFIVFLSLFFRCFYPFFLYHRTFLLTVGTIIAHRCEIFYCLSPIMGGSDSTLVCRSLDCHKSRTGGGCQRWHICAVHLDRWLARLDLLFISSPFLCLGFLPDFHYLYLIYTARNYRNQRKNTKDYRLLCNCE